MGRDQDPLPDVNDFGELTRFRAPLALAAARSGARSFGEVVPGATRLPVPSV
jgi:hypothetical protein